MKDYYIFHRLKDDGFYKRIVAILRKKGGGFLSGDLVGVVIFYDDETETFTGTFRTFGDYKSEKAKIKSKIITRGKNKGKLKLDVRRYGHRDRLLKFFTDSFPAGVADALDDTDLAVLRENIDNFLVGDLSKMETIDRQIIYCKQRGIE